MSRYDTCLLWGCASTSERRQQISRKDIYRASPIRPTDKWLSLRDLIIAMCQGINAEGSRALAIKRSYCSDNEEDKLEQLERKTIPTSGEISLFIIAFL